MPKIFDLTVSRDVKAFDKLRDDPHIQKIDTLSSQIKELHAVLHPENQRDDEHVGKFLSAYQKGTEKSARGRWAYFPWLNTAVRVLADSDFQKVRTARNRELISEAEQDKYYGARVGIAGLSIGNSAALAIVLTGGARSMKLADFDTLELSNLNRIRAGIESLGLPKVQITARQIYSLNPYQQLELYEDGITPDNVSDFCSNLDIIVDELDSIEAKTLLRIEAKKRRIPVVMAADCADSGIVDVERYDLSEDLQYFHGRLPMMTEAELSSLDKRATGKLIAQHVGLENHNERMLESLLALGKSIPSWPQLGSTALLNGAAIAFCVRQIATGKPLIDNRAILSLEETFDPSAATEAAKARRGKVQDKLRQIFGL